MRAGAVAAALLCWSGMLACSGGGGSTTSSSPVSSPVSSSSSTPTSLTKSEFVAKANALCATRNDQLAAIPSAGDDPQVVAGVLQRSAAIVAKSLVDMRKLPIPAGDEAAVND